MNMPLRAESLSCRSPVVARFDQFDDLTMVLGIMADVVDAASVTLSVQRPDATDMELVACHPASVSGVPSPGEAAGFALLREAGSKWVTAEHCAAALLVALPSSIARSRVLLTFRFDRLSAAQRQRADAYAGRRPFADGYFDLWQRKRLHERRCAELEDALDRSDGGVILIGRDGHVLFANEAAKVVLAEGDGLRWNKGSIRATNLADSVHLQIILEHVTASWANGAEFAQGGQIVPLHRRMGSPLLAMVMPSEKQPVEPTDTAAIIYLAEPVADPGSTLSPVCRMYGFSPVETKLVGHLVAGRSLTTAADAMSVKEQTARGYLRNIFIKTATSRQAEMIALLYGSLVHVKRSILTNAGFSANRAFGRAR